MMTASTGSSGVVFPGVSFSSHMDVEGGRHEFDFEMET